MTNDQHNKAWEKRSGLGYWLYRYVKNFRESMNKDYHKRHGRAHPWSLEGEKYDKALADQDRDVATPPPIHGEARWISTEEAKAKTFAEDEDFMRGRKDRCLIELGNYSWDDIGVTDLPCFSVAPGNILTVAPTRSGKGTGLIIPNLLQSEVPIVVVDPKGENFRKTGPLRHNPKRRQHAYCLDPFNETGTETSRYNPLDFVDRYHEARVLAEMLLPPEKLSKGDPFWYNEALNFLTGVVLYVAGGEYPALEKSLFGVRSFFTEDFNKALAKMKHSRRREARSAARTFDGKAEKERSGVQSHINSGMAIWDDEKLHKVVSASDFDFRDMKRRVFTVYIVLPFELLSTYSAFLRVMVGSAINAMMKDRKRPKTSVLFLMDEFPALGPMPIVVDNLGRIAGYGVRFWLFAQNLHDLRDIYGQNQTSKIVSECSTQNFFGTDDHETAEYISKCLGMRTIGVRQTTIGHGGTVGGDGTSNVGESVGFYGQSLLTPDQVMQKVGERAPDRSILRQLVFQRGYRPALVSLNHFYRNPDLVKSVPPSERGP